MANNTFETAMIIDNNSVTSNNFDATNGFIHYYLVTGLDPSKQYTTYTESNLDLYGRVYNPSKSQDYYNDDSGTGSNPLVQNITGHSSFYVRISGYSDRQTAGAYTLYFSDMPIIKVTGISMTVTPLEMVVGKEFKISASVIPSNSTENTILWTSSNDSVATVGLTGVVTPISVGDIDITATTLDGAFSKTRAVTVREFPVFSPDEVTSIRGGNESLAFIANGDVWGVGSSYNGMFGLHENGDSRHLYNPTRLTFTGDYTEVTLGESQMWVLKNDGTVWGIGDNWRGSITGVDTGGIFSELTLVPGIPPMKHISGCSWSACIGITLEGRVWAWGNNSGVGLLPTSTREAYSKELPGLPGNIKRVISSAEGTHAMALTDTDDLWVWGDNGDGECGDGTHNSGKYKLCLPRLLSTNVLDAACTWESYSLVVKKDHTLWFCGVSNDLVYPTTKYNDYVTTLKQLTDAAPGIVKVTASYFAYALTSTGDVWGWGANFWEQISSWDEEDPDGYPPPGLKLSTDVLDVYQGSEHAGYIRLQDGIYYRGTMGQIDNGYSTKSEFTLLVSITDRVDTDTDDNDNGIPDRQEDGTDDDGDGIPNSEDDYYNGGTDEGIGGTGIIRMLRIHIGSYTVSIPIGSILGRLIHCSTPDGVGGIGTVPLNSKNASNVRIMTKHGILALKKDNTIE